MTSGSDPIGQDEIEQLLKQAQAAADAAGAPAAARGPAPPTAPGPASPSNQSEPARRPATPSPSRPDSRAAAPESGLAQGDIELLLRQAEEALASVNNPVNPAPALPVAPFKLQDFSGAPASTETATLDLIRDVELNLKIELGRTHMYLEDVLKLRKGSVVPLDKLAGDPVDIYVNGRLIARGEVLVLNDNFAVRVAELVAADNAA